MSSWIGDFWRRHRRKFFITGVVLTGCYAAGKVIQWKITKWQHDLSEEYKESQRVSYFEKNQITCRNTYLSFELILKNSIEEYFDTVKITEALRSKPDNRIELWEELKIMSFAKSLSSLLGSCVVLVYIKVLMNIVGGYMFIDEMEKTFCISEENDERNPVIVSDTKVEDLHRCCTDLMRYATGEGFSRLMRDVHAITRDLLGHRGLKEPLKHEEFGRMLRNIWKTFRDNDVTPMVTSSIDPIRTGHSYAKYMISDSLRHAIGNEAMVTSNDCMPKMILESVDVTDSSDCFIVINACIQNGLDFILKDLQHHFQQDVVQDIELVVTSNVEPEKDDIALPLAKVMPLISAETDQIFNLSGNDKQFADAIMSTPLLHDFCNNIYDSFSSKQ